MRSALGTTYQFQSSLPLLGRFSVDMPVASMTAEAMQTARVELRAELRAAAPWVVAGALLAAFLGAAAANWIVPARSRA